MDLFAHEDFGPRNILPHSGTANFFGTILSHEGADKALASLMSDIEWRNDEYYFAGKHIVTARKIAWYGDAPSHSNQRRVFHWVPALLELKELVERICGHKFQSCLLNLYHSGEEGLGWHSDGEKTPVASLSLGATRRFVFKNKADKGTLEVQLAHGDLLVMEGETQDYWLHRVPPMKSVKEPRINLTFRQTA
ncbi:2OG-Fe(II) oxygenase superfamily protein [Labrenzia sp. THAF82]|uniref:alpha-ketoglutarate-dependent dioxygenase AlkB family protein n=1 Tax=Labrenzia sp. THAF82 TaxID=2587861 RepID=UPI001269761C|nr:alpha-ketoglutarate-dependent dioxygenase AlkB [Labrenzia sp. THAF82]QFT30700.1 2OG-Fe(II) oxygenase superfamily protein [Labrenzia sp. THAF82]